MSQGQRRLAAIMFTDMVGYTALAQDDEKEAMALLQKHNEALRPILGEFHGREVKTIGDSFLVEFDSALEATECAVKIQQMMESFNKNETPSRPLQVRIGIHVGDVIHQGSDVLGDAVNLASRVLPLAEPGGVCISEQVYVQVRNKLQLRFVQLPPQTLKNVKFEMAIYKVVSEHPVGLTSDGGAPRTRVAVLPFTNISHDQTDEYFADGVTEELITAISQVRELKVIARTSTARYKGTPKSVAEIGRELGVGSILEGSTRMAGNKVRVSAQLIDTSTEEHIWANNYDRQLDDIFSIQSEIAKSVSEALRVQLLSVERKELEKKPTASSSAFIKYLKGRASLHNRKEADLKEAASFFEQAISEDPSFAMAHVGLADAYSLLDDYFAMPEALQKSRESLKKALAIDPSLPEAHVALAYSLQDEYKFQEAVDEYEKALTASPNYAQGHHWYGVCLWDMGRNGEALVEMSKAEELDPLSVVITFNMAYAHRSVGDKVRALEAVAKIKGLDPDGKFADEASSFMYELDSDFGSAAECLERVCAKEPKDWMALARLGKMYAFLGETSKAQEVLARLERQDPYRFYHLSMVRGALGERDETFKLLERAYQERSLVYRGLLLDVKEFGFQDDDRYRSLLERVGLDRVT